MAPPRARADRARPSRGREMSPLQAAAAGERARTRRCRAQRDSELHRSWRTSPERCRRLGGRAARSERRPPSIRATLGRTALPRARRSDRRKRSRRSRAAHRRSASHDRRSSPERMRQSPWRGRPRRGPLRAQLPERAVRQPRAHAPRIRWRPRQQLPSKGARVEAAVRRAQIAPGRIRLPRASAAPPPRLRAPRLGPNDSMNPRARDP